MDVTKKYTTHFVSCKTGLHAFFKYWFTTRKNYVCQIQQEGTDCVRTRLVGIETNSWG